MSHTSQCRQTATTPSAASRALRYAVAALLVACYFEYLIWMLERWWNDEYYGHGLLLPIVSGFLIWRRWPTLTRLPQSANWIGVPLILGSILVHGLAIFLNVHFPSGFAFLATAFGLIIWLWGSQVARAVAFPVWYLVLAIPLGRILVDQFAQPLQLASAGLATNVATAVNIPAVRDGTAIHTPDYTFEVAVACSGLKSVIAMSALAVLYAYLVQAAVWKRTLIVLASLPIALAANGSRIILTLTLGRIFGSAVAEGFFHSISGLFVFLMALIAFFLLGALLRCNRIREDI